MSSRDQRLAENETRFRRVNEQLLDRWEELEVPERETLFICECADRDCTAVLRMTLAEYEAVRASPHTFAIVSGHEDEPTETVVTGEVCEADGRFAVVRKRPAHQPVTEASDPRA
jgi:hypothetical protein